MRLIKTEEEKIGKIYAPYYDYTKTPALSPDAPDEAVKAYQKAQEQQAGQNNQGPKENEDGTVDASYEEKK